MSTTAMRLRYAGVCCACSTQLAAGERGFYDKAAKSVRCLPCGATEGASATPAAQAAAVAAPPPTAPQQRRGRPRSASSVARCGDCGRRIGPGDQVLDEARTPTALCRECVLLDVVHVVGLAGGGARAEYDRRVGRREQQVRKRHPRLGGLILALSDDPRSTRAWGVGAHGEEAFGAVLSGDAGPALKVLHDRKRKGSDANIDHLAVTPRGVWVLDAKRWSGRIETRGGGLLSRREPDLYVDGRDRTKAVVGVRGQVAAVQEALTSWTPPDPRLPAPPVEGALVFVDGDFGWFASPMQVRGVAVTWGKQVRARLRDEADGPYPAAAIAKHLAAALRPGLKERPPAGA